VKTGIKGHVFVNFDLQCNREPHGEQAITLMTPLFSRSFDIAMDHGSNETRVKGELRGHYIFRGIDIDLQFYCLFPDRIFPKKGKI